MMFEDQRMSVDSTTPIKGAGSLNSSGSSISMDIKPLNSWAQEVRAELGQSDEVYLMVIYSTASLLIS